VQLELVVDEVRGQAAGPVVAVQLVGRCTRRWRVTKAVNRLHCPQSVSENHLTAPSISLRVASSLRMG
jgi:hypothetical protein